MSNVISPVLDSIDNFLAWASNTLKQTNASYCDLETADLSRPGNQGPTTLVAHDGSLVSVIRVAGSATLLGRIEFEELQLRLFMSWQTALARPGHAIQVLFNYDRDGTMEELKRIFSPASETGKRLNLDLDDIFNGRLTALDKYCTREEIFLAVWTRPWNLTKDQQRRVIKNKQKQLKKSAIPIAAQNLGAAILELRESHESLVRSMLHDLQIAQIIAGLLNAHQAIHEIRKSADPEFTAVNWQPWLPGDKIPMRELKNRRADISELLWPTLSSQILPRDAENLDLRTTRIGDRIYTSLFIELFPKDVMDFIGLFQRTLPTQIPWRISFLLESGSVSPLKIKSAVAAILAFTSAQNRLIHNAIKDLLERENKGEVIVRLRVALSTWAKEGEYDLLRNRAAQLAKAVQGWGMCEVSEFSGDPFGGVVSSMLAVNCRSEAPVSLAPLPEVLKMLPLTRPASSWLQGAVLFRSPDGKPWPYQPGSSQQTTWIDLIYARPGSGKSVLSNTINFALCLSAGLTRLPRIAVIDIGPSSSGLISLLKEAVPSNQRHLIAYHRLRMIPEHSINPFDTQLGCRYPASQERAFLVNFLTLLATPVGAERPYDGISDMAGMIVDELYRSLAPDGKPHVYTKGLDLRVDSVLEDIAFVQDQHTTWWEVTDALFLAGFPHEAGLAQRHTSPLLADTASICRIPAIADLYGNIKAPTGETLIDAFARMVSAAVREYPILSRVTRFDLGEARIVSLDLDEVARSGGEAADRQTAVMYMLARYILARHYYLTEDNIKDVPEAYHAYHGMRIAEIRQDPKRIVYDEFHRTARAEAVRSQVILDMREGRKWNVQVALISQSLDDFDRTMVEFATSTFIMDAGPLQAIKHSAEVFGLSETAQIALRMRVHGPREGGATFLAQFATKHGLNTQLLTLTLGPSELWALSTTAEDANVRNQLYRRLGPAEARRVLARLFPNGSVIKEIEKRLTQEAEEIGIITDDLRKSALDQLVIDILNAYSENPEVSVLVG